MVGNWSETEYKPETHYSISFTNVPEDVGVEGTKCLIGYDAFRTFEGQKFFQDGNSTHGVDGLDNYVYSSLQVQSLQGISEYEA
jgi:hypothetical protein